MQKEMEMRTAEMLPSLTREEREQLVNDASAEPIQDAAQIGKAEYSFVPRLKKPHAESLLKIKDIMNYRFIIKGMIGKGGYGQIYRAADMKDRVDVAVKAEPTVLKGKLQKRMIFEQKALMRLQGRVHVPLMVASGMIGDDMNFIVLQLLSRNVGDLKEMSPVGKLGRSTVARIMVQAIAGIRDIHSYGYLHRDIKPANMCFGVTSNQRHILKIVDYGMVRKFKGSNGSPMPLRKKAGFRGTLRYASLRVHQKIGQSPPDDLVSLAYSTVELLIGNVPWKCEESSSSLIKSKMRLESPDPDDSSSALNIVPHVFDMFFYAIFSLQAGDEPNYDLIQNILFDITMHKGLSEPYDWEEDYIEAMREDVVSWKPRPIRMPCPIMDFETEEVNRI